MDKKKHMGQAFEPKELGEASGPLDVAAATMWLEEKKTPTSPCTCESLHQLLLSWRWRRTEYAQPDLCV